MCLKRMLKNCFYESVEFLSEMDGLSDTVAKEGYNGFTAEDTTSKKTLNYMFKHIFQKNVGVPKKVKQKKFNWNNHYM